MNRNSATGNRGSTPLKRPAIRVVTIAAIALVAALVCFGLLESTATGDSGGWSVGGAFAGFVIACFILDRIWKEEDTSWVERVFAAGAEIAYLDAAKILDLRHSPPDITPQVSPLSNYFLVQRTEDDRDFTMHFATSGRLEPSGSPTHGERFFWADAPPDDTTDQERFQSRYQLRIPLDQDPVGKPARVVAEVRYIDAFTGAESEGLETHVDQAMQHISMCVLMPEHWIAEAASVKLFTEGRHEHSPLPEPTLLQGGAVVFWSMCTPPENARLQLTWTWSPRLATTTPPVPTSSNEDHQALER